MRHSDRRWNYIMNVREVDSISLFHFHVTQISRAAGQSAIASAAYRAGEKLHSDYYGEDSDYTAKHGVLHSEILLPPHAPERLRDRETLWNEVEKAEQRKDAQLAYSFDIALQNELSFEENLELTRKFLQEKFVAAGMIVDFAIHDPECDGTQNPHFHVMAPIRPLNPDGTWGAKQRMVYRLDEAGQRIRKPNGKYAVDAVPTTDWGRPETLDRWREAWADLVNEALAGKGLDCRIDHRSYAEQAVDLLPTVHEGVAVRQMEQRGIRTEKGDLNRWIKATNRMLQTLKKKLANLKQWIDGIQIELKEREASPNLVTLLSDYYTQRNQGTLTFSPLRRAKGAGKKPQSIQRDGELSAGQQALYAGGLKAENCRSPRPEAAAAGHSESQQQADQGAPRAPAPRRGLCPNKALL